MNDSEHFMVRRMKPHSRADHRTVIELGQVDETEHAIVRLRRIEIIKGNQDYVVWEFVLIDKETSRTQHRTPFGYKVALTRWPFTHIATEEV